VLSANAAEISSKSSHRVRTLPQVNKKYSKQEWKKIVHSLAPKKDSLDAKPIDQRKIKNCYSISPKH
jgi:hypothetical protein